MTTVEQNSAHGCANWHKPIIYGTITVLVLSIIAGIALISVYGSGGMAIFGDFALFGTLVLLMGGGGDR
ncbi:MAG: hypothetical protein KR126chlam2_00229 [Chlamydiae bacterium]|nr:hypothetical protein [Chlamydiota bacterium]